MSLLSTIVDIGHIDIAMRAFPIHDTETLIKDTDTSTGNMSDRINNLFGMFAEYPKNT
jgi:hypothetical protein